MSEASSIIQTSCFSTCWKWTTEHKTEVATIAIATILLVAGAYFVHQSVCGAFSYSVYGSTSHIIRWCAGMPLIVGGMGVYAYAVYLLNSKTSNPRLDNLKAFLHEEAQKNKIKPEILESELEKIFNKKLSALADEINQHQGITYDLLTTALPLLGLSDAEVLALTVEEIELYNDMQLECLRYRSQKIPFRANKALMAFPEGLTTVDAVLSLHNQALVKTDILKTKAAYLLPSDRITAIMIMRDSTDPLIKNLKLFYAKQSILQVHGMFDFQRFMRVLHNCSPILSLTDDAFLNMPHADVKDDQMQWVIFRCQQFAIEPNKQLEDLPDGCCQTIRDLLSLLPSVIIENGIFEDRVAFFLSEKQMWESLNLGATNDAIRRLENAHNLSGLEIHEKLGHKEFMKALMLAR